MLPMRWKLKTFSDSIESLNISHIWSILQGVKRYCFFCRVMSGTHFRYWYDKSTMLMLKSTVLWCLWRDIKAAEHVRSLMWSGGYPIHVSVHKILRRYILAVGLVEMTWINFILKINYSWKIKILSSYGIVLTFMLHGQAQILFKQQFQPRQSHWCQAQICLILSLLFAFMLIFPLSGGLSAKITFHFLLFAIIKLKKLKKCCFLVEKVLLFISAAEKKCWVRGFGHLTQWYYCKHIC